MKFETWGDMSQKYPSGSSKRKHYDSDPSSDQTSDNDLKGSGDVESRKKRRDSSEENEHHSSNGSSFRYSQSSNGGYKNGSSYSYSGYISVKKDVEAPPEDALVEIRTVRLVSHARNSQTSTSESDAKSKLPNFKRFVKKNNNSSQQK